MNLKTGFKTFPIKRPLEKSKHYFLTLMGVYSYILQRKSSVNLNIECSDKNFSLLVIDPRSLFNYYYYYSIVNLVRRSE